MNIFLKKSIFFAVLEYFSVFAQLHCSGIAPLIHLIDDIGRNVAAHVN